MRQKYHCNSSIVNLLHCSVTTHIHPHHVCVPTVPSLAAYGSLLALRRRTKDRQSMTIVCGPTGTEPCAGQYYQKPPRVVSRCPAFLRILLSGAAVVRAIFPKHISIWSDVSFSSTTAYYWQSLVSCVQEAHQPHFCQRHFLLRREARTRRLSQR